MALCDLTTGNLQTGVDDCTGGIGFGQGSAASGHAGKTFGMHQDLGKLRGEIRRAGGVLGQHHAGTGSLQEAGVAGLVVVDGVGQGNQQRRQTGVRAPALQITRSAQA